MEKKERKRKEEREKKLTNTNTKASTRNIAADQPIVVSKALMVHEVINLTERN